MATLFQTENEDTEKLQTAMDDTIPTFHNGLITDIRFYSIDVNVIQEFIIAKRDKVTLPKKEFNTLNPRQELSNFLMAYICSIIVPSDIQVDPFAAGRIFKDSDTCLIKFTKNKVLLPLLKKRHWVLLIIDFEQKTFACLNSCRDLFSEYNFYERFLSYIKKHSSKLNLPNNTDGWKEKKYDIDQQKDDYNCGIFVVDYIKQYVETETVSKRNLCADTFRDEIKLLCIKGSDGMRGACLGCGGQYTDSPECRRCKRGFHCENINIDTFRRRKDICPFCYKYQILFGITSGQRNVPVV